MGDWKSLGKTPNNLNKKAVNTKKLNVKCWFTVRCYYSAANIQAEGFPDALISLHNSSASARVSNRL